MSQRRDSEARRREARDRIRTATTFVRGPLAWIVWAVRASRVVFMTTVIALVVVLVYVRTVRASASERAVTLGRELAQFADVLSGTHRVVINGETVYVAMSVSDQDIGTLLDRFEGYCDAHNGGVIQDFVKQAPEKAKEMRKSLGDEWFDHWGVIREQHEAEGMVMCIAQESSGGMAGMSAAVERFKQTWDLHTIGDFRYVYARAIDNGKTQVFTSLTEGPFNLKNIFGADGQDAPGQDLAAVPRLTGSRRVMTSRVDDAPYAMEVMTAPQPVAEALAFYEAEMPKAGWMRLASNKELGAQAWQRQGVTLVLGAGRGVDEKESAQTKLTFTEGRIAGP